MGGKESSCWTLDAVIVGELAVLRIPLSRQTSVHTLKVHAHSDIFIVILLCCISMGVITGGERFMFGITEQKLHNNLISIFIN